jgi:predicted kinase
MATVYFLCGMAASGKTTFAKELAARKNAVRLTLDERMIAKCDFSIFDEQYGLLAGTEKLKMWDEAKEILSQGRDVVLDWSLWSRDSRAEWTQKAIATGHDYKLIFLNVPFETLRQRLSRRNLAAPALTHIIPLEELERFWGIFEPPSDQEGLNLEIVDWSGQ